MSTPTSTVTLSDGEFFSSVVAGVMRRLRALRGQRSGTQALGKAGDLWSTDIEAAASECAVAKALGLFWPVSSRTDRLTGDVGGYQVRLGTESNYRLVLRDDDLDDHVFIFVTGKAPTFTLVGWLRARDGKRPEYLETHKGRPAVYFVPRDEMRPMSQLPRPGEGGGDAEF